MKKKALPRDGMQQRARGSEMALPCHTAKQLRLLRRKAAPAIRAKQHLNEWGPQRACTSSRLATPDPRVSLLVPGREGGAGAEPLGLPTGGGRGDALHVPTMVISLPEAERGQKQEN